MHKNIVLWKTVGKTIDNLIAKLGGDSTAFNKLWGDSDALLEWTPSLHIWATIGYFDLPFSVAPEPKRYSECEPCKHSGRFLIGANWPW